MKHVLLLGLCAGVSLAGYAQEKPAADTAVKIQKDSRISLFQTQEVPSDFSELGRTQIITRQQIDASSVQTLSGVIATALNTSVQSIGPMGSMKQVYMQGGSGGDGVLVLLDGRRMNSVLRDIYTLDNLPVSLEMVDHIEIRTGGDSKRYGEYAVNGVINIVTRKVDRTGVSAQAYGGNQSSYGGGFTGAYQAKNLDVVANVSGGNASWEKQEHSDARAYLHARYKVFKWMNMFVDGSFVYNNYNMPYMLHRSVGPENMNTYSFRGVVGFDMPVGPRFDLFATYSYSNFKEQYDPYNYRNTPLDDPYAHYLLEQVDYTRYRNAAFDLGGKYRARMIDIFFGFNFNSAKFMSSDLWGDLMTRWVRVPGKVYNYYSRSNTMDSWRIYYNMSLKFKKWYVNAGVSLNGSVAYEKSAFMYGAEVGYNFGKQVKVFAGYDRSFRNATFYQKYAHDDFYHGFGETETNNEIVSQWNIGIKYENEFNSLSASAYTLSVTDAIVAQLQQNTGYFQYANYSSDPIAIQGIEARYRIDLDKATHGAVPITNLSVAYAYNTSDMKNIKAYTLLSNNYLEQNGRASASVRIVKGLSLDVDFSMQKRAGQYVQSLEAKDTMNYKWNSLLDARLTWKPQSNRYQIYVQGQNLLNQNYFTASFVRAQELSVVAGVKYNLTLGRKKKY